MIPSVNVHGVLESGKPRASGDDPIPARKRAHHSK